VGKGVDLGGLGRVLLDAAETRERVDTVNVHGTRATDTLTARAAEGKGGVLLVLDLDLCGVLEESSQCCAGHTHKSIEHHRTTLVEVDLVRLELGLLLGSVGVLDMSVVCKA